MSNWPPSTQRATASADEEPTPRTAFWGFALAGGLSLASIFVVEISVFAVLVLVIALAATTRLNHPKKQWIVWGLSGAMVLALVAMTRFVLGDALAGIIEARGRATSARAVSMLREILFAQDALRRYGFIDPDGDGIGSAGTLGELSGVHDVRGGATLDSPPLAPRYAPQIRTAAGPALRRNGYLYLVCLPAPRGGWSVRPGEPVDDEKAERTWIAYAWPATAEAPQTTAYFIDEHETILESPNVEENGLRLVGKRAAPRCSDRQDNPGQWKPWRDKMPRKRLPGDD